MNPILIAPIGSILPANHQLNIIVDDDLCSALTQAKLVDVPFMTLTVPQLQAIATYPDVFMRTFIVVEFLDGGKYDVIWSQYTTGFEKVSALMLSKTANELRDDPTLGKQTSSKFGEIFDKAAAKDKAHPLTKDAKAYYVDAPDDDEDNTIDGLR